MKFGGHVSLKALKVCENFERNQHMVYISYDRSTHSGQICLKNHCCQSNSLLIIRYNLKNYFVN